MSVSAVEVVEWQNETNNNALLIWLRRDIVWTIYDGLKLCVTFGSPSFLACLPAPMVCLLCLSCPYILLRSFSSCGWVGDGAWDAIITCYVYDKH